MKFSSYKFWKHSDCLNAFVKIDEVVFDSGDHAILNVVWCNQQVESWFFIGAGRNRIVVKREHYDKWNPYQPVGKIKL